MYVNEKNIKRHWYKPDINILVNCVIVMPFGIVYQGKQWIKQWLVAWAPFY